MTDTQELFSIFRRVGSTRLVIFERDGLLLRQKNPSNHLALGDIDEHFVEMLGQLRDLNLRFGFISDQRGMDAGSYGRSEFAALTRVLDGLLSIHGAIPDFWMAWGSPPRTGTEAQHRDEPLRPNVGMILQAIKWYDVDNSKAVFVSKSPAGIQVAKQAKITGIQYSGGRNDRVTEVQRLGDMIEQILRLDHRRTA
jgi:histidinol phosphatase-like enzyme